MSHLTHASGRLGLEELRSESTSLLFDKPCIYDSSFRQPKLTTLPISLHCEPLEPNPWITKSRAGVNILERSTSNASVFELAGEFLRRQTPVQHSQFKHWRVLNSIDSFPPLSLDDIVTYLKSVGSNSAAISDLMPFLEKLRDQPSEYWNLKTSIQRLSKPVTDNVSSFCTHTNLFPLRYNEIVDEKTGDCSSKPIGDDIPARILIDDDQLVKIFGSLVADSLRGKHYSLQTVCRRGDLIHPFLDLDSLAHPITPSQLDQIIDAHKVLITRWFMDSPLNIETLVLRNQGNPNCKIHVHFPGIVLTKEQWKRVSEEVKIELPSLSHLIDTSYSGLRLPLCKKKDDIFSMYYLQEYDFQDPQYVMNQLMLFIKTHIRAWKWEIPLKVKDQYQNIFQTPQTEHRENEEVTTELQEVMLKYVDPSQFEARWEDHGYHLKRTHPGHCSVCNREHESDNAMITIHGGWVVYKCWRNMKRYHQLEKFRNLTPSEVQQHQRFVRNRLLNAITYTPPSFVQYNIYEDHRNRPMIVPREPTPEIEKDLQARYSKVQLSTMDPTVKIQVIWSPMDTGKTYQLIIYLRRMLQAGLIKSFVFLSTRIKFARSLHTKLQKHLADLCTVGSYLNKSKSCAYDPCLVISTESLAKSFKHMDLIIMDEVTSCLVQMDSGLHDRSLPHNQARLINLIRNAKYIVAMDADIDRRAVDFLHEVRPDDAIHLSHNTVKKRLGWKFHLGMHKVDWYIKIQESLARGQNIVCPVASSEEGDLIYRWVTERCGIPDDLIRFYRQSGDDHSEELEDVETHWRKFRVLIYTSTINVGIDFSEVEHLIKHYDVMFVYTTVKSNTIREIKQMMGRVRNVKDQVVYHCQSEGGNRGWVPTTSEAIYDDIQERLNYQNQELDRQKARLNPIIQDYKKERTMLREFHQDRELCNGHNGDVIFAISNTPFSRLRIQNIREINLSCMYHDDLLSLSMENQGFECIPRPDKPVHLPIIKEFSEWAKASREQDKDLILGRMSVILNTQSQMTPDQLLSIDQKIQNGQATEGDKLMDRTHKYLGQMQAKFRSQVTANQIELTEKYLHSLRVQTQYTSEDAVLNDLNSQDRGLIDSVDLAKRTAVQEMSQLLGVPDLMTDRTTAVKCEHLRGRVNDWMALCPKLMSIFKLRRKTPPKDYRGIKEVVDKVLKTIGLLELQIIDESKITVGGQQERRYTYKLKAPPEIDQAIAQIDRRPPINKYVDRRNISSRICMDLESNIQKITDTTIIAGNETRD